MFEKVYNIELSLTWPFRFLSSSVAVWVCFVLFCWLPCCSIRVHIHLFHLVLCSQGWLLLPWWCHQLMTSAWACFLIVVTSVQGEVGYLTDQLEFILMIIQCTVSILCWWVSIGYPGCTLRCSQCGHAWWLNTEPHLHSVCVAATMNIKKCQLDSWRFSCYDWGVRSIK